MAPHLELIPIHLADLEVLHRREVLVPRRTDKDAPLALSSSIYAETGFVHRDWLTEDQRFSLLGDELDLSDLDAPVYVFALELESHRVAETIWQK